MPLYSTPEPDVNLMDFCTVEGQGGAQDGCDPLAVLKQAFDDVSPNGGGQGVQPTLAGWL